MKGEFFKRDEDGRREKEGKSECKGREMKKGKTEGWKEREKGK